MPRQITGLVSLNWMLNPIHFQKLDNFWGPYSVDRFASLNSNQLPRFCASWLCPGCEGVNAFTLDWRGENNWRTRTRLEGGEQLENKNKIGGGRTTGEQEQDWRGENNWLVPPVFLIPRVLKHMTHNGESGTLVVPFNPQHLGGPCC